MTKKILFVVMAFFVCFASLMPTKRVKALEVSSSYIEYNVQLTTAQLWIENQDNYTMYIFNGYIRVRYWEQENSYKFVFLNMDIKNDYGEENYQINMDFFVPSDNPNGAYALSFDRENGSQYVLDLDYFVYAIDEFVWQYQISTIQIPAFTTDLTSLKLTFNDYIWTSDNVYYNQGQKNGYDIGYNQGVLDGVAQGKIQGQEIGYNQGKNEGYTTGFNDGLQENESSFNNLFGGIANTPFFILQSLLSFEVFGISAFSILFSIITLLLALYLIRKFTKE